MLALTTTQFVVGRETSRRGALCTRAPLGVSRSSRGTPTKRWPRDALSASCVCERLV